MHRTSQLTALHRRNRRWVTASICVGLLILTWAVFGQTLRYDFVNYDDPSYVYQNTRITSGINSAGVAWAFSHVHSENWHPLTTITHMLDCQLHGLNAGWHHFTNVLLHSLAVVLLFVALRAHDRRVVAQRVCVRGFRRASVACGVGRVDRGTQRRAECVFLHAHPARVLTLHARAIGWPVFNSGTCRCPRVDVQTDAGYTAVRSFTARLLAACEI